MAATVQHACNRRSDTDTESSIFRNDSNNVAALQTARMQKTLLEEAARLQQQQLEKVVGDLESQATDKKKVEEERDALRREKDALAKAVEAKDGELRGSRNEVEALNVQKQNEVDAERRQKQEEVESVRRQKQSEYDTLKTQKDGVDSQLAASENTRRDLQSQLDSMTIAEAQRRAEIGSLTQTLAQLEKKVPNNRLDNCLPFQYHGATVMFVQLNSQMALDASREGDTRAQAWAYGMEYGSQIFTLMKLGGAPNQDQPWAITRTDNGKNLQFINGEEDWDIRTNYPNEIPGRRDYWFIGRGSADRVGSWVLKNAEWGTCIELSSGWKENGRRAKSLNFSNHVDANWVIIPLTMNT